MKGWKDTTTIEISTPEGGTTGPIPAKEFSKRVKGFMKTMVKINTDDSTPEYWRDSELEEIGKSLIQKHHNHLLEAEISYLVTSRAMSRAGKRVAGKARKTSGVLKYYARADFEIVVSGAIWGEMLQAEREALVDHELSHCSVEHDDDGNRNWVFRGHDIEEFIAVVDRHGLWHEDLKTFGEAVARQLELPLPIHLNEKAKKKVGVSPPAGTL